MPAAKPAKLLLLNGRGDGKDAAGRPVKLPPSFRRTTPERPEDLGLEGGRFWDQVVAELPRLDLLKELDGAALAMACHTIDRWAMAVRMRRTHGLTTATGSGTEQVAPWVRVEEAAEKAFRGWCQEFGLTPSGEMKLATLPGKDDDGDSDPFA